MNVIIIGQGAMGLLWYHHIVGLFKSDLYFKEAKLHLLPSKKDSNDASKFESQRYNFTDQHNVKHRGNIRFAETSDIQNATLILLCVKSFHVSSVLQNLKNHIPAHAAIILAHNGMGTINTIPQNIIKRNNIFALLTTHGCLRTSPYNIVHTGFGTSDLGLLSGHDDLLQQDGILKMLDKAMPSVTFHQSIKYKQWLKLAVNCVINSLTSIHNIDNGQINNIAYKVTISTILEEVVVVAKAENIVLDVKVLKKTVEEVAYATAKNCSSMRCDILANRESEIDYINGYIHRLGQQYSLATPMNTLLWQKVKAL